MPAAAPLRTTFRTAGLVLLPLLLAACGERTQPELAQPLGDAYRMLTETSTAADDSCTTAPALAMALGGWLQAVDEAGLQSRFASETADARQRVDAIRARCADAMAAMESAGTDARPEQRARASSSDKPASNEDPRPTITPDLLDAWIRGMEEEIALMRATNSHFVSLSKYDEHGLQVAEKAGLPLPEYRGLRDAVTRVMYVHLMHERYGGADGQARLARLEAHKREHAIEILASEPFATLSPAEREALQARLDSLRALYDRYMEIAAIAD